MFPCFQHSTIPPAPPLLRCFPTQKRVYELEELVGKGSKLGMELKRWDGKYVAPIY